MSNQHKIWLLKLIIHLFSMGLISLTYFNALNDNLGADPVEAVLHFTGIGAINLLLLSLVISPLVRQWKLSWLMQVRRLLGLYAFFYALCHVLSFWAFEIQFNVSLFFEEIIERPYITVGLVSFMLLMALAITSWSKIKRKMGKSWQKLHNWVYLAITLAVIHFYWSVKSDLTEPLIYFIILVVLLSFRKNKFIRK
ncbi:protein-methionine-sulfoxide reductase heme-binding subunit MsrQ [Thalassotalea marina]|uniref:Protein-methionine-sulfoxide reductase heme-binding subunit MsrQ n=1 Tax=Thalassotalea marina TaxID=1673741 RepID=A0A919EIR9_9GAMM|nr:protein-methionine-sulfoxide reductase heme-binding subunit MsrQ [Thalassotalea marina]GHF83688.1 protein-methionine-sulfoxide reductase heme-binding subunit MsrQ [Thalassotalea marina]